MDPSASGTAGSPTKRTRTLSSPPRIRPTPRDESPTKRTRFDDPSKDDDSDAESVTMEDLNATAERLEGLIKAETGRSFESYTQQQAEIRKLSHEVTVVRDFYTSLLHQVDSMVNSMKPLKLGIETLMVHMGLDPKQLAVPASHPPRPAAETAPETPPKPPVTLRAKEKAPMKASEDPAEHIGNPPSPSDSSDDEDDEGSKHRGKGSKRGRTQGRSSSTPFVGDFVSKESAGTKFKPSKPKDFDGTRTELKGFLSQTKVYLAFYGIWEDVNRVLIAQSFFTGKVRTWFQPFLDDWLKNGPGGKETTVRIFSKFEELEKELHEAYGDSDEKQTAIRRLEALRQTTSAATYKSEFQQLIPVVGWDSAALQRQFWKGLKNDVQDVLIRSEDPATLEDLMEQAIKVDNRLFSLRQERKTAGDRKQKSGKDRQERPGKSSHTTRSVRKDEGAKLRMERFRAGACLACGKKGHLKKDCPEKQGSKQVVLGSTSFGSCMSAIPMYFLTPLLLHALCTFLCTFLM